VKNILEDKIPPMCRVNNLGLRCQHVYPSELRDLTAIEERLVAKSQSFGFIARLEIDKQYVGGGGYRKLKRGHITVFPNNLEDLSTNILPHPLVSCLERIAVCFIGSRQPPPRDVAFMLAVRPAKIRAALVWLKEHNPLYHDVTISNENLQTFEDQVSDNVPCQLYDIMECVHRTAEEIIQNSHYVSAEERGIEVDSLGITVAESGSNITEILAGLRAQRDVPDVGLDGQNKPLEVDEDDPENELFSEPQFTWSGSLSLDTELEGNLVQRVKEVRDLLQKPTSNGTDHNGGGDSSYSLSGSGSREPFIISRRGHEFEDLTDPDFFPKAFPKLFPFGVGGPRTTGREGSWGLVTWARYCLQSHGKNRVTFLVL